MAAKILCTKQWLMTPVMFVSFLKIMVVISTKTIHARKMILPLLRYKWAGSQSYFYLWNNGATTQSISNKGGGSYWVKITDTLYGCVDTLFITVTDDTCSPCQYFNAWINENDPCQKNDIILIAYPQDSLGTTRYKYLWNTGATSKSLTNKGTGSYWVKVTDSVLGCVDTAYITVNLLGKSHG
jgi:hypothetical protein